jgi:hypothetical protein
LRKTTAQDILNVLLSEMHCGISHPTVLNVQKDVATGRAVERRIVQSTCVQSVYNSAEQMAQAVTRKVLQARYAMYCHL